MTMSVYADSKWLSDVASNQGWRDLCGYIAQADAEEFPNAQHLCEFGWTPYPPELRQELERLSANRPPRDMDVRVTLDGLIEAVSRINDPDAIVVVSDGLS